MEWIRWGRKPFLFLFFSLGAGFIQLIEKIEALMGGEFFHRKPGSATKNLLITFSGGEDDTELLMPFVPLFSSDNKWVKLKYERVLRDFRRNARALKLPGRAYGKSPSEGTYRVGTIALLSSQKEVALFLKRLRENNLSPKIGSILATRRSGAIPNPKGLLIRMAMGSRRLELIPARGGDKIVGAGLDDAVNYLSNGVEYHHLFLSIVLGDERKCVELISSRTDEEMKISLYGALNIQMDFVLPIFLLEPAERKSRMEDSALLLIQWQAREQGGGVLAAQPS